MQVKSISKELDEVCSKIARKWCSKDNEHCLDLSYTNRILNEAHATVKEGANSTVETTYMIGLSDTTKKPVFYLEIGKQLHKKKYLIKQITKDHMVVSPLEGTKLSRQDITYIRVAC